MNSPRLFHRPLLAIAFLLALCVELHAGVIYAEELSVQEVEVGNFLQWQTLREIRNRRFRIQKSLDGMHFVTIAEVSGKGTAEGPFAYRFLDPAIGESAVWYRLAQEDEDGTVTFSHVVRLVRNHPNRMLITAMSHTVTDRYFSMTVLSKVSGEGRLILTDASQVRVWERPQPLRIGEQVLVIDMEPLPEGVYQLALHYADEREVVTIVKAPIGQVPRVNIAAKH